MPGTAPKLEQETEDEYFKPVLGLGSAEARLKLAPRPPETEEHGTSADKLLTYVWIASHEGELFPVVLGQSVINRSCGTILGAMSRVNRARSAALLLLLCAPACLAHTIDSQYDGDFNLTTADGTPVTEDEGSIWKAAYHDSRAFWNVRERLNRLAAAQ